MRDYPTIAAQYIDRVLGGTELVCRKVRLTIERHVRDLERSKTEPDYPFYYDPTGGVKVCRLFELVMPSKWRTKMLMQPWMVCCTLLLYGWKRKEDEGRRFQVAFLDWARKTGKSAYLSVLGIYHLTSDGERGAEVYSAALVEQQARRVFDEAAAMVAHTPVLRKGILTEGQAPVKRMRKKGELTSEFRPLSRDKDAIQGTFPSFAAGDELHVWKGRGCWDDIRYGMTARQQPLIVGITTAPDADDNTSIANSLYNHADAVLTGAVEDDGFFTWIAELDPEVKNSEGAVIQEADKWDDERVWVKACPNLGITVRWDAMRQLATEARNDAEALHAFKKYSLNIRVESLEQPITVADWNACARPGDPVELRKWALSHLAGRICFGALDLALTEDTSALALCFPPVEDLEKWLFLTFFWIPEKNIQARVEKSGVPYAVWREQGYLITTPGKVTDYDFITGEILDCAKLFDLRELAYDPALASGLIKNVLSGRTKPYDAESPVPPGWVVKNGKLSQPGLKEDKVVKFAQTMLNYAAPCGDFVRAIARQELEHLGDPILRWQANNLRWLRNHTGLIMPDKETSKEKIDGVVASIMAFGRANHPDNAKLIKAKPKVTVL